MILALYIALALIATGVVLKLTHRPDHDQPQQSLPVTPTAQADADDSCCGLHLVCDKKFTSDNIIEYYDDEELDRFANTDPATYTVEQTEAFRNVLYTMLPSDISGWKRSLELRSIQLPHELHDEMLMILDEARTANTTK